MLNLWGFNMDKRLKKLLIKSTIALASIVLFIVFVCCLFLNVPNYAMAIICIIIPVSIILILRIIIHTAMNAYLYTTYDGSEIRDENEIKLHSLISKFDLITKVITGILVSLVILLAVIGRSSSPADYKDINTNDFIDVGIESIDIKSEKYFSNCIVDYFSYGEKCNNYNTTLHVEKIVNSPNWFIKYHFNRKYDMLDKNGMRGEHLTIKDASNEEYSCAYVLRENGTRISLVAMNKNNFIELTVSNISESGISVDTEKVFSYVNDYFKS